MPKIFPARGALMNDFAFPGEPAPFEIERKYLIEYPDVNLLASLPDCQSVEIIQTYLKTEDGSEKRVRLRSADGHRTYYCTIKKAVSDIKRVEIENQISQDEYLRLLTDADPDCRPIQKTRYCLTHQGQCFEIDIYPFWNDKAIMEIELRDENTAIHFPPQIKVIKEVTADKQYKNASLAKIKQ